MIKTWSSSASLVEKRDAHGDVWTSGNKCGWPLARLPVPVKSIFVRQNLLWILEAFRVNMPGLLAFALKFSLLKFRTTETDRSLRLMMFVVDVGAIRENRRICCMWPVNLCLRYFYCYYNGIKVTVWRNYLTLMYYIRLNPSSLQHKISRDFLQCKQKNDSRMLYFITAIFLNGRAVWTKVAKINLNLTIK